MKKVLGIHTASAQRWVGDGFPARSLFAYHAHGAHLSPFLLMDHAGPFDFPATDVVRGVGQHPHRGFETVTIVYEGEVEHRDSIGAGGIIGAGDVQWMTAGAGILHEEFHSPAFGQSGGTLDMVQLWVNLPAKDKMGAPGYQTLLDSAIPKIELEDGAGLLRVIAGEYEAVRGPARTHTPLSVIDAQLRQGRRLQLKARDGWTLSIAVLHGAIRVNRSDTVRGDQWILLDRSGGSVFIEAEHDVRFLALSGEPIDEPIAGMGPFVMNTDDELDTAFNDFNSGRFGQIGRG